ncbi:MAG: hypothetical protein CSH36_06840 [Thalassolituus sp.]|nr:MAG: hypothetical protein CSH36_06840 [Thalassolituus sp.]
MAPDYPERHGIDLPVARRIASPLLWLIRDKRRAEPDAAEWTRMGLALLKGDPLADRIVDYFSQVGHREGWGEMEIAAQGRWHELAPDSAVRTLFSHCTHAPGWVDEDAMARGAKVVARSGKTGMRILRDFGLMAGYQASAINQTLVKTGALEKGAQRRVAETTKWWMDCTAEGGLTPGAAGFNTTLRVRVIHAMVRERLRQREDWDAHYLGLPVNQLDMQVTWLAFSVMFLLGQRVLGVPVTQSEAADVMALWRYIGWLMGVDESLLCASEQEGRVALYRNLLSQAQADGTSVQLARALMDEPLQRYYGDFQWLRSHWDKQVHLSIIRLFIGSEGMRVLGLPGWVVPWYPMVFTPCNFLAQSVIRLFPGGRDWLARRGRRAQEEMLTILFGSARPDIIQLAEH